MFAVSFNYKYQVICSKPENKLVFIKAVGASVLPFSEFGSAPSGLVLFDSVHCTGTEDSLLDCPHSSIGNHFCNDPSSIVAIQCKGNDDGYTTTTTTTITYISQLIARRVM